MRVFKTSASTLQGVISNQKHTARHNLILTPGELILIQLRFEDRLTENEPTIRWVMDYVETYKDTHNESDAIWGQHYNYIIRCENLRPIEGLNLQDIQVTNHDYKSVVESGSILAPDEQAILNHIGDVIPIANENVDLAAEFNQFGARGITELIDILNQRYAGQPNYRTVITRTVNRPTALRNAIIQRDGTHCKICGCQGFQKRNGGNYCEVHHMIELNNQAPNTLQSWNTLVLCPTCHKQIHHGNVESFYLDPGWRLIIDGTEHIILN